MSTIAARKNPLIMANDFVRNYKKYESYLKHCINILKTNNWLKEHQFDELVSDYDFMSQYFNENGIDEIAFMIYVKHFNKDVISKLPKSEVKKIKTNRYYCDALTTAISSCAIHRDTLNMTLSNELKTENEDLPERQKPQLQKRFSRQFHYVMTNGIELEDREYTEKEIIELIAEGKLLVVSSGTDRVDISEQEIQEGVQSGKIEYFDRNASGGFIFCGNLFGDISDFFEVQNEIERQKWFAKNIVFLKYLRQDQMTFDRNDKEKLINCSYSFDITFDHIDKIITAVNKNFKSRKKKIPIDYEKLAEKIILQRNYEKQLFNQSSSNKKIISVNYRDDNEKIN